MAKITVRIPTEAYAYVEVSFDSIEEYKSDYPKFAKAMIETRKEAKKVLMTPVQRFEDELGEYSN